MNGYHFLALTVLSFLFVYLRERRERRKNMMQKERALRAEVRKHDAP